MPVPAVAIANTLAALRNSRRSIEIGCMEVLPCCVKTWMIPRNATDAHRADRTRLRSSPRALWARPIAPINGTCMLARVGHSQDFDIIGSTSALPSTSAVRADVQGGLLRGQ